MQSASSASLHVALPTRSYHVHSEIHAGFSRNRGLRPRQLKITIGYAMLMNESDTEIFERDQSQHQVDINGAHHEEKDRTLVKQEVINEAELGKSCIPPNSANARPSILSGSRESPELSQTTSRTEAVRQDVRRLKSVTLDRMGKLFRTRMPAAVGRSCLGLDTNVTNVGDYDEKASRKEKTNSLGRILKFVDTGGSPRKLFVHPRAGSLSRILRRHPHNEDNGIIDKPAEDTGRGIFSRMLSQLRGRPTSETTTKPDTHKRNKLNSSFELPSEVPLNSKTTNVM